MLTASSVCPSCIETAPHEPSYHKSQNRELRLQVQVVPLDSRKDGELQMIL
jgi:hypothetical protein